MKQHHSASPERNATAPEQPPVPVPEHKRLEVFVGTWKTEGQTKAGPSGPAMRIDAVDTYAWLPGRFFLVHRWVARIGDGDTQGIELIGYDTSSRTYPMRQFDSQGNFNTMQASVRDGIWTFAGESERCTVVFSDDGNTFTGAWERSTDGSNWAPWMDVKLTKVK